jgi:hypothetical protein
MEYRVKTVCLLSLISLNIFKYLSNNLRARYSIRYIICLTRILHLHLHFTDILDLTDPYSGCLLKPFGGTVSFFSVNLSLNRASGGANACGSSPSYISLNR